MDALKNVITNIFKQGIKVHLVFLSGLFLIAVVVTLQSPGYKQVGPKALFACLLMVACIYSGRWLSRQFLKNNSWLFLILFFCLLTGILSAAGIFSMAFLLGYKDGSDVSGLVVITTLLVIIHVFAGAVIATTRMLTRQQIRESRVLQYQAETELNLLTSKLSPHFLFNTLNNLYGLSREDHTKVPDLLLKLSDLLSYALYSSGEAFVKLEEEVAYILNFIALEKIRIGSRLVLDVNIAAYDPNISIAPMVLIVFVENAFKHAKNTVNGPIQIALKLWTDAGHVYFEIENTTALETVVFNDKTSGIGIATTVKRLDLLYGDVYRLAYGERNNCYFVKLRTPINAAC